MNRYNVAAVAALVATVVLAVLVGTVGEPYDRSIARSVVLLTTVSMALLFLPFIFDVLRGHGREPNGALRKLDVADLFGAGISLIGFGVAVPYARATFFNTEVTCAGSTTCYGIVSALQVILLGGACWMLLSAFVFIATGQRRNWFIVVLSFAILVAVTAYIVSTRTL